MTKMRLCRFTHSSFEEPSYGYIEGHLVFPLDQNEFDRFVFPGSNKPILLEDVRLIAPIRPSKIVCVGRNYKEHAAELGNKMPDEPLLFLKVPSAVIGSGESIRLPSDSQRVEHEGELGVVIGRKARQLPAETDPLSFVFGYTCVNDVTARDLQRKDVQFTRAKAFDTFCPVGPVVVTGLDPANLEVTTRLNGEVKQQGRTSNMAFSVSFLVRYIANIMTLYPGDLIVTGTPAGVSPMKDGDVVEVEVEGIGVLSNPVTTASERDESQVLAAVHRHSSPY
jgi:2-keto-4-pentenoate hydratase/2-oxohepta-3-ene-1,7-dioic acid hydratase in catechol pathway